MVSTVKRVAAVHDLSCFGRAALTVIIPTLSAMEIQVCPLPTAVLSTHLGGFSKVAFCDLSENMANFLEHWKRENVVFDSIYSGFLASTEQIDTVVNFIDDFSDNNPLVLVDPVMGDEGRLYSVYTTKMQEQMQKLVRKADIITPNYTEACFLLEKAYLDVVSGVEEMKSWLVALASFGPRAVVITGIPLTGNRIMNLGYNSTIGGFTEVISTLVPAKYPGTGDIFASVLLGSLLQGHSLAAAMNTASAFVELGIKTTFLAGTPPREGVLLEAVLPWLYRKTGAANQGIDICGTNKTWH